MITEIFATGKTINDAVEALKAKLFVETLDEIDWKVVSAGKKGGAYPAVANGANDQLVKLFLEDKIKYNDIYVGIDSALNAYCGNYDGEFDSLSQANDFAVSFVKRNFGG